METYTRLASDTTHPVTVGEESYPFMYISPERNKNTQDALMKLLVQSGANEGLQTPPDVFPSSLCKNPWKHDEILDHSGPRAHFCSGHNCQTSEMRERVSQSRSMALQLVDLSASFFFAISVEQRSQHHSSQQLTSRCTRPRWLGLSLGEGRVGAYSTTKK